MIFIKTNYSLTVISSILLIFFLGFSEKGYANSSESLVASVNHNRVQLGQEIQFTLSLNNKASTTEPDFSLLNEDFEILSGASRRSSKNFVNGSFSSSSSWTISITPRKIGSLVIPPIKLAGLESQAIIIVVSDTPNNQVADVFFEIQVDKDEVYVHAQLRFDLKLYIRKSSLSNTQLDNLTIPNTKVFTIGEDRQSELVKNGISYYLLERSFFIFPEKSGVLEIPALNFSAVISEGSRFSQFSKRRRINAQSQALSIKVLGIPASFPSSATWLPAENIILSPKLSPTDSLKLGDPVTLTITTQAKGLYAGALPPFDLGSPEGFQVYPDQGSSQEEAQSSSLVSRRVDSFALIPNQAGELILPEYKLPWWDTRTNTLRYASIPEQRLTIEMGSSASNVRSSQDNSDNIDAALNSFDEKLSSSSTDTHQQSMGFSSGYFWGLLLGFIILWLATIAFFLFLLRKQSSSSTPQPKQAPSRNQIKVSKALEQVKSACSAKDTASVRNTLLLWGELRFPHETITGLSKLAELSGNEAFSNYLKHIDNALYSNSPSNISFEDFWGCLKSLNNTLEKLHKETQKPSQNGKKLSELYTID